MNTPPDQPLSLLDALAVLACTPVLGKRNQVELKRAARAVVDAYVEKQRLLSGQHDY